MTNNTIRAADGQEYCIVPVMPNTEMLRLLYERTRGVVFEGDARRYYAAAIAARPALPADLAALVKDAERYRWLRDNIDTSVRPCIVSNFKLKLEVDYTGNSWTTKDKFDAAVDAAIAIDAALQDKSAQRAGDGSSD